MLRRSEIAMKEKKPMMPREVKWFLAFWFTVIALLAVAAFVIDVAHQQSL
jgi:hypothetical protein